MAMNLLRLELVALIAVATISACMMPFYMLEGWSKSRDRLRFTKEHPTQIGADTFTYAISRETNQLRNTFHSRSGTAIKIA